MPKQWTVRELAEEFGVSKQAINKRLDTNFRRQHVTTKTVKGVATLIVDDSGKSLLYKVFKGDNEQPLSDNENQQQFVALLKQQIDSQNLELKIKNEQLAVKDEQLKSMQQLLDQSQQLQLMTEKKLEKIQKISAPEQGEHEQPKESSPSKKWWQFNKRG